MQHDSGKEFQSKNFYSATKNAFEMISNFYKHKEKSTKFYNLKLYEAHKKSDTIFAMPY